MEYSLINFTNELTKTGGFCEMVGQELYHVLFPANNIAWVSLHLTTNIPQTLFYMPQTLVLTAEWSCTAMIILTLQVHQYHNQYLILFSLLHSIPLGFPYQNLHILTVLYSVPPPLPSAKAGWKTKLNIYHIILKCCDQVDYLHS